MVIFLGLFLGIPQLCAETIFFKSGRRAEGKIIERTDSFIKVDVNGAPVTFFSDEIDRIEGMEGPGSAEKQTGAPAKQSSGGSVERTPEYDPIYNIMKDVFQHRFDQDKTVSQRHISKSFQAKKLGPAKIGYSVLDSLLHTELQDKGIVAVSLDDLQMNNLQVKGDSAEAKIVVYQTLKRRAARQIFLKKEEGEWKITDIVKLENGEQSVDTKKNR